MSRLVLPDTVNVTTTRAVTVNRSGSPEMMTTVQKSTVEGDSFIERVAKYVPAEILAAYVAVDGYLVPNPDFVRSVRQLMAAPTRDPSALNSLFPPGTSEALKMLTPYLPLAAFAIFLVVTPLYFWQHARTSPKGTPWIAHACIATVAFVVWAYTMHGSFFQTMLDAPAYDGKIASAAMFVFTTVSGLFAPGTIVCEQDSSSAPSPAGSLAAAT